MALLPFWACRNYLPNRYELAPAGEAQVVFRDSTFADDVAKTNITAILKQRGLENVRSL